MKKKNRRYNPEPGTKKGAQRSIAEGGGGKGLVSRSFHRKKGGGGIDPGVFIPERKKKEGRSSRRKKGEAL